MPVTFQLIKQLTRISPRSLCTSARSSQTRTTLVNFSLTDSDSDSDTEKNLTPIKPINLPPPYNPFNKTQTTNSYSNTDPTNLQEVFHNMRHEGMFNNAVKMFDELSKQELTHEALELFSQIKEKGTIPDVLSYTAVIEAYAEAGKMKEAIKVYERMLASRVLPNVCTYGALIKGLVRAGRVGEVGKWVREMVVERGMKVGVGLVVEVVEVGFARDGNATEGVKFVAELRNLGVVIVEHEVREVLKGKSRDVVRNVLNILFDR